MQRHAAGSLGKGFRWRGIKDLKSANRFLEEEFLEDFNTRFTVKAAKRGDLHRRVPPSVKLELVLAFQEERRVQNDWTVRWQNRWLQVTRRHRSLNLAGRRVMVVEQLDGQIQLLYQGRCLEWQELAGPPERAAESKPVQVAQESPRPAYRPGPEHPWRHPWRGRLVRAQGITCLAEN